ncbi:hypothetical protein JCM3766R1_006315 [Sporobolomyces carnicolor]
MLVAAVAFSLLSLSTGALPLSSPPSTGHQLAAIEIDSWKDLSSIPFSSSTTRQRRRRDVKLDLGDGNVVVLDAVEGQDDRSLTEDSSFNDDDDDGASEEQVFEPSDDTKVVRNPKVIPNPKSPNFMSTSSSSPAPTSTSTTTSSSPTASAAVTTYKGEATYFFQGGVAGACGNVNPDSALIVALDYRLYGDLGKVSKYCGKSLTITNTANGKSVQATVADACPTCSSKYSLDLSEAAFGAIGDYDTGILPIQWHWN